MHSLLRHLLLPLLLLLSCLVFSISPAASQRGSPVLDSKGKPVLYGVPYQLTAPLLRGDNDGLGMTSINRSCPLHIHLQTRRNAPPVVIQPDLVRFPTANNTLYTEIVGVHITFTKMNTCPDYSAQWMVNEPSTSLVTTGGSDGHQTMFKVVEHRRSRGRHYYELYYCSGIDLDLPFGCTELGLKGDDQLLGENLNAPLVVKFTSVPKKSVAPPTV